MPLLPTWGQEIFQLTLALSQLHTSEAIVTTRSSRAWIHLVPVLVVLDVILVFVFQDPEDVRVSIFTFSGALPLSKAILGAVVLGARTGLQLGSVLFFPLRRLIGQGASRVRRERPRSSLRLA